MFLPEDGNEAGGSPARPLLVFNGACCFCRRWVARWRRLTGDRVAYAPYQEVADRHPEIPRRAFEASVQLIDTDGRVYAAAEAVARSLATVRGLGWLLRVYYRLPGARPVAEWAYRYVADGRGLVGRLVRAGYL